MNLLSGLRPARKNGEGVVWLGADHAADRMGGKAATLSRLAARWAVPDGFCRSSGVDEDGEQRSFAGQHDTFLNVKGARAIARAVERCWASNDDDRCLQLAQLATDVERDIGAPVDLECALEDGRLHLLQARPITTLAA